MRTTLLLAFTFSAFTIASLDFAHAWGRRGHAITCHVAGTLASTRPSGEFLRSHTFDLGYYCNTPDLVWKKGDLYQKESFNHFMDLEIFERAFKGSDVAKPFELTRDEFNAKFPKVENSAGRAYWRIRELMKAMGELSAALKKSEMKTDDRHALQADWLLHAGAIGHYVGDLAQPLHVTENYDGQMTSQKGVHAWFEDDLVDELFLGRGESLESLVMKAADQKWRKAIAPAKGKSAKSELALLEDLAKESNRQLKQLLKIDKDLGRKNIKEAAAAFKPMLIEQLATGAVTLAQLWSRELGWDYDGKKFYNFHSTPTFIEIPKTNAGPSPTPSASPAP